MTRGLLIAVVSVFVGCAPLYVEPPAPINEGSFLVHVVRSSDESFNKILSWYTGTALSQSIVLRFNPQFQQRDVRIGDRVLIPVELVANQYPYGVGPTPQKSAQPNLLMGEEEPPRSEAARGKVEMFGDEMNIEAPLERFDDGDSKPAPEQAIEEFHEIPQQRGAKGEGADTVSTPAAQDAETDMPPPGLLEDFQGS